MRVQRGASSNFGPTEHEAEAVGCTAFFRLTNISLQVMRRLCELHQSRSEIIKAIDVGTAHMLFFFVNIGNRWD